MRALEKLACRNKLSYFSDITKSIAQILVDFIYPKGVRRKAAKKYGYPKLNHQQF